MNMVESSSQIVETVQMELPTKEPFEVKFWTKNNIFRFSAFAGICSFLLPWFLRGDYSVTLLDVLSGSNAGLTVGGSFYSVSLTVGALVYLLCLGAALISEEAQMYSLMGQVGAFILIASSVDDCYLGAGVALAAISFLGMVASARYN